MKNKEMKYLKDGHMSKEPILVLEDGELVGVVYPTLRDASGKDTGGKTE